MDRLRRGESLIGDIFIGRKGEFLDKKKKERTAQTKGRGRRHTTIRFMQSKHFSRSPEGTEKGTNAKRGGSSPKKRESRGSSENRAEFSYPHQKQKTEIRSFQKEGEGQGKKRGRPMWGEISNQREEGLQGKKGKNVLWQGEGGITIIDHFQERALEVLGERTVRKGGGRDCREGNRIGELVGGAHIAEKGKLVTFQRIMRWRNQSGEGGSSVLGPVGILVW